FRKAQELLFDRSRAIPLAEYSLKLDEDAPFLTRERDRQKFGPDTVVAAVEERLQVAGLDNQPALGRLLFTFVKRDGKWLIASDTPLDDLGLFSGRHPWDFGAVEAMTSEHFMLIVHAEDSVFAAELLSLAEQALPNVDGVYKRGWNKKVVIYVPATKRELERIIDATFEVDPFVAFASAGVDRDEGWVSTAPRIILNRANFLRHTAAVRRAIFAHELLHIATRDASGPFVSAFVEEGFAQMAETQSETSFRRAFRGSDVRLKFPEDVEFVTGGQRSIGLTYNRAHSAFAFIQETFGIDKLNEFYVELGSVRSDPGTTRHHLDASSRQTLGLSLPELEAKWAAYVTSG
ncbi:MAG: hypothetical protein ACRD1T_14340, partial [Acidimicrobiia bacterium]